MKCSPGVATAVPDFDVRWWLRRSPSSAPARFWDCLCGDGGGSFQGDGVAELFELGDQATRLALRVLSFGEVVIAEVLEHLAGAQEMPHQLDQCVGDGDGCFVGATTAGDLAVLRAEVASPWSGPRLGRTRSGRA